MGILIDFTGQRFGKLVVEQLSLKKGKDGSMYYDCICDCGNKKTVARKHLRSGNTTSCKCHAKAVAARRLRGNHFKQSIHGQAKDGRTTKEYRIWTGLRSRCNNRLGPKYRNYGGRGITCCKEWDNFSTFFNDMGRCPIGMSIDRIDNNQGYSKENCRWATPTVQGRNRRTTILSDEIRKEVCLSKLSATALGAHYGVSANAIRLARHKNRATKEFQ